jgi:hypothetical protein
VSNSDDGSASADDVPASSPGGAEIAVDTVVSHERGRWVVEIVVAFPDGVVRHRINEYPTERHARIAADWIRRTADRDIEGPLNG